MFEEIFSGLKTGEQERFRMLCSKIMSRTYIIRDYYDKKEKRMIIHPDYRFIERNIELYRDYLEMAGWILRKDNSYGVIYVENIYGHNRVKLNKFSTILLLVIRLIFEENREEVNLKNEVVVKVNTIVSKMLTLNIIDRKPSYKDISDTMRILSQHNIIDKFEGRWEDPETKIIIYPSILFIIPSDKITRMSEIIDDPGTGENDTDQEYEEETADYTEDG